ncbi:MAG: hypothetical protein IT303_09220 [Dehalococcoidia bacterium]|nr:hypothetical protein [Dehalococcoidia bacterium]
MPDRGLLDVGAVAAGQLAPGERAPWRLAGARWAQITFEVAQQAALAMLPPDTTRPIPTYARLFVLDAPESPAGPFRLAALLVGARYRMLPRNVLVDGIVEGPVEAVAAAYGGPFRAGTVALQREGPRLTAEVAAAEGPLAAMTLPALYATEPGMLRWDAWLGFASTEGRTGLVEFVPQQGEVQAWLSKGASVEMAPGLPREHRWRTFRDLLTISACYVEGEVELGAAVAQ